MVSPDSQAIACPLSGRNSTYRPVQISGAGSICFAHVAYRLHERFSALNTGINSFAVRDSETLEKRVGEADVLVISGLWQNGLLDRAKKLRFIQAIGAGTDQFARDELAERGIRLASSRGVNARAVAEHAVALIL